MARRYREARLKSNIKLTEATEIFDVAQSTVSAWEGERKEPNLATIEKMAELYHVSIDYLLGRDSFEFLSAKDKIPQKAIGLFHGKPVWVPEKGWALVNITDKTLVYMDREPERIGDNEELYFAPPPYSELAVRTDPPLLYDQVLVAQIVWVEPIIADLRLREMLRGRYKVMGEYVENARGNRFTMDSYGGMWVAYIIN